MRHLTAADAARAFISKAILSTALLCFGTACSQTPDASSIDDAALSSLNIRGKRTRIPLGVRDSSLTVGDTLSIVVQGVAETSGSAAAIRRTSQYRSSDTAVVEVDAYGLVRAVGVGVATVSVRTLLGTGAVLLTVSAVSGATSDGSNGGPKTAPPPPVSDSNGVVQLTPAPPTTTVPPASAPALPLPTATGALPAFVAPQLPQATVDISMPSPGRTIRVTAGDAAGLQAALDAAVGGDEIVLPDGSTFVGSFHLPNRAGGGTIVLRSATIPVNAHTRITPSQSGTLATLLTTSVAPALVADDGARGWHVVGVRMQLADNAIDNYGIVTIGSGIQTAVGQFPRDIVLDRIVVNGSTTGNTSRCVAMNGVAIAVVDSWLSECHANGRDAQAIAAWTGTGPLLVENNHLEGSGQAIMLGGSDPLISGVTPADVVIRRNHLFKPLSWAGRWTVKAAFEIKNAERVLFEANVIENHWADAQVGFAVLLQAVNQDSKAPWSTVRDVTIRLNVIRNSRSGVDLLSRLTTAAAPVSQPSRRIEMRDNSFEAVGRDPISGAQGRFVQLLDDLEDVTILQNTFFGAGASNDVIFDGKALVRLVLSNNVFANATYGILGSAFGEGAASLARFAPGASVSGNVLTGLSAQLYPPGNAFPASLTFADFVDAANGNYSLRTGSAFGVLNGARAGVDGAAVLNATAGVTVR